MTDKQTELVRAFNRWTPPPRGHLLEDAVSNYRAEAFNPRTGLVEEADWLDNHFGPHIYGVRFADGGVYTSVEVSLEAAGIEIARIRADIEQKDAALRPFRKVDVKDCEWLIARLSDGGHDQFWRTVLNEYVVVLTTLSAG